jgi:hypothetical protein
MDISHFEFQPHPNSLLLIHSPFQRPYLQI